MPIGATAEGSERTWMGRNRSKTGRKALRITASRYREILHETLLRGTASAVPALKTALGEVETRLGWTRERRQRIVLRLDGGFGTTEVLNWLLSRGYQVVAKISHSGRVRKLRQAIGPWQPTSSPGREMATVLQPHRFCRTTRQWVIRTPKEKGGYQYAVLMTTLTDLEPVALADAYDSRALIEATFCQDKQALGLVTRRQRKWEAQQMVLLLARLAHHLLLWGKQWLSRVCRPPGGGCRATAWCACSGTCGRCPGSSGGGAAGWSACALHPCTSQPRSRRAFPPCFTGVCGKVVC